MWTCFLSNKDRQLAADLVFLCHRISCGVGSNGKLAQRKPAVAAHDHLFYQVFSLLFGLWEISAAKLGYFSVFKYHTQVFKEIIFHINLFYMKKAFCACKHRRGKYFSQRNIYIGYAVFKISLLFRVGQRMKLHLHGSFISIPSCDLHIVRLV